MRLDLSLRFLTAGLLVFAVPSRAEPQSDSAAKATWTISEGQATVNQPFSAWLTLPATRDSTARFAVTLISTPNLRLWIADSTKKCLGTSGKDTTTVRSGEVLSVCALGTDAQSAHLVAIVHELTAKGSPGAKSVAASETVKIDPKWNLELPGWLITLITALLGFASGLGLQWWQRNTDRQAKREDDRLSEQRDREAHVRKIEDSLANVLAPELIANRKTLEGVVNGQPLKTLLVRFGQLLVDPTDTGLDFLSAESRHALDRLQSLYQGIAVYNSVCNEFLQTASDPGAKTGRKDELENAAREIAAILITAFPPRLDRAADVLKQIIQIRARV